MIGPLSALLARSGKDGRWIRLFIVMWLPTGDCGSGRADLSRSYHGTQASGSGLLQILDLVLPPSSAIQFGLGDTVCFDVRCTGPHGWAHGYMLDYLTHSWRSTGHLFGSLG